LLFSDATTIVGASPHDAVAFTLRDDSLELRRLFLHAVARYGDVATYLGTAQQRPLAGTSASACKSDVVLVALMVGRRSIGVVVVNVEGEPDRDALDLLTGFCRLAARLIDMDRALLSARRQSRDSRLLAMVNERLHKSLDRRDVLFGIVEGVRAAFGADRCIVYQRSHDGERAVPVAVAAQGSTASITAEPVELDADLRKVFGGLTLRTDDSVAVPFVVEGRVEDALMLSFDRPNAFDDADVTAVRSLAFHVGLALSNARLYERERARRKQAESLERVVRILRDTQYVDEVLLVFVVTVSHELPVDCAAYRLEGNVMARRALRLREQRSPVFEERIERQYLEPFFSVDEPSDAALLPRAVRGALFEGRSGVVVPLRLDGGLWGMLAVRGTPDAELEWSTEERVTFFRTLGSHLEIALANAHAYERELRRAQERETLAEAARTILSHRALGPLAAAMCRLAATLVHAGSACVLNWHGASYVRTGSYGEDVDVLIAESGFDTTHRVERSAAMGGEERRIQRFIDGPGYVVVPLPRPVAENDGDTIDTFLLVGKPGAERFGRDELRLLQELGALLVLALRNIELYEAVVRANYALQESSEFKDDLLAMLAHDFKGPLTVISGYCELLLESDRDHEDEIETVNAQTQRLIALSEDALVLAQTQAEGFSLVRTTVDLGTFVKECVEATAPNNPRLVVSVPKKRLPVELDPQRFRHVIDNLVSNALKYSEAQALVTVRAEKGRAVIAVADRGIGIPPEELPALFTRFGRASNARNRGIAGSGIGLYVAKKVVEAHRGTLDVQSKENEGSTFTVSLPIAENS
jgi:signal transduction histidine kinase